MHTGRISRKRLQASGQQLFCHWQRLRLKHGLTWTQPSPANQQAPGVANGEATTLSNTGTSAHATKAQGRDGAPLPGGEHVPKDGAQLEGGLPAGEQGAASDSQLSLMTAAGILFSPSQKPKRLGFDFHLWQAFMACLPPLVVYLTALYARSEMRRLEREAGAAGHATGSAVAIKATSPASRDSSSPHGDGDDRAAAAAAAAPAAVSAKPEPVAEVSAKATDRSASEPRLKAIVAGEEGERQQQRQQVQPGQAYAGRETAGGGAAAAAAAAAPGSQSRTPGWQGGGVEDDADANEWSMVAEELRLLTARVESLRACRVEPSTGAQVQPPSQARVEQKGHSGGQLKSERGPGSDGAGSEKSGEEAAAATGGLRRSRLGAFVATAEKHAAGPGRPSRVEAQREESDDKRLQDANINAQEETESKEAADSTSGTQEKPRASMTATVWSIGSWLLFGKKPQKEKVGEDTEREDTKYAPAEDVEKNGAERATS